VLRNSCCMHRPETNPRGLLALRRCLIWNPCFAALHRTPRPLARASPLGRVPRVPPVPPLPPLAAPLVNGAPLVDAGGAGTRDWRFEAGVWYLPVDLEDVGGFSTNEVSVVLGSVSLALSTTGSRYAHKCGLVVNFAMRPFRESCCVYTVSAVCPDTLHIMATYCVAAAPPVSISSV
jgi:hypothetical protein